MLLVDSDTGFRERVAVLLRGQGHEIMAADDARHVAVHRDFVCDDLAIREPGSADAQALAASLRRLNPYLEVRDIGTFAGALAGVAVDSARLFQFLFDLWDWTLRSIDATAAAERRRARARADLARELAAELGLEGRVVDELFLHSYLAGAAPYAARAGFAQGSENPLEAMLRQAGCPYDLAELLAPVPPAPPPEDRATLRLRIVACAASLAELAGQGLGARELLERTGWAAESPDLALAGLRVLARRGELVMPGGEGREIIVVDTDVRHAGALWMRFIGEGFGARFFHDGEEALQYMLRRPAALVVSEVELPGKNGVDLCAALKSNPSTRDAKLFFLSREADPAVIMRGLAAGAEDYLIKPANLDLLVIKVRRVLGR